MIEHLAGFSDNVVAVLCSSRVTKADYDSVLIPAVDEALRKHRKVRLYYETGVDFAGLDLGAAGKTLRWGWKTSRAGSALRL